MYLLKPNIVDTFHHFGIFDSISLKILVLILTDTHNLRVDKGKLGMIIFEIHYISADTDYFFLTNEDNNISLRDTDNLKRHIFIYTYTII